MRLIILFLFLSNLGFFYWQYALAPAKIVKNPVLDLPIPAGVKRLSLFDETAPIHIVSSTQAEKEKTDNSVSSDEMVSALIGDDDRQANDESQALLDTENDINNKDDVKPEIALIEDNSETIVDTTVEVETNTKQADVMMMKTASSAQVMQTIEETDTTDKPELKTTTMAQTTLDNASKVSKFLKQLIKDNTPVDKSHKTTEVSDTSNKKHIKKAQSFQAIPIKAPPVSKKITCYKTGLYASKANAKRSADWLTQQTIDNTLITRISANKSTQGIKTQLYLAPFNSEREAKIAQQHLRQRHISDHAIIRKGRLRLGISLGIYRNGDSVTNRLAELRAKGYFNVKIQLLGQKQLQQRYQLKLSVPENKRALLKKFSQKFRITLPVKTRCTYE